ncbi:hypothetical protein [Bacillus toyonensis]|uniref:hypothetical protein n=1 Tax=Bacillus toyonensis TaxID=155322 RepID=UPI002E216E02|nr:hypothetical protein [Bacillus toyonensis]
MKKAVWVPLLVILVVALGFAANYFMGSGKVKNIIERADSSLENEDYKKASELYSEASDLKKDEKTDDLKVLSKEMNQLDGMKKTETPKVTLEQVNKVKDLPKHQFEKQITKSLVKVAKETEELQSQLQENEENMKVVEEVLKNKELSDVDEVTKKTNMNFTIDHPLIKDQEKKWSEFVAKAKEEAKTFAKEKEDKKQLAEQKKREEQKKKEEQQKQLAEKQKQDEQQKQEQQKQEPVKKEVANVEDKKNKENVNNESTTLKVPNFQAGVSIVNSFLKGQGISGTAVYVAEFDTEDQYGYEVRNWSDGGQPVFYGVNKKTGAVQKLQ